MVAGQGNPKSGEVRSPAPPLGGGQQQTRTATAAGNGNQTSPKLPAAGKQNTEVLNQTRKLSVCPAKVAGGVIAAVTIGYFALYSKKKPEATALDVAKVATGTGSPANTRPRN